jgi:hypothetical protein
MADAGSIGTYRTLYYARPLPMWVGATLNSSVAGVISGTVKQSGVALPYAMVALYYRVNGQLVARQRASATGTFSFGDLQTGLNDYYVVALDDTYNALVFDTVAAV